MSGEMVLLKGSDLMKMEEGQSGSRGLMALHDVF